MTGVKSVSAARLAGTALYVMAWPALLFMLAGDARGTEGWLFTGYEEYRRKVRYRLLPLIW
jgi:hypothetical protein